MRDRKSANGESNRMRNTCHLLRVLLQFLRVTSVLEQKDDHGDIDQHQHEVPAEREVQRLETEVLEAGVHRETAQRVPTAHHKVVKRGRGVASMSGARQEQCHSDCGDK